MSASQMRPDVTIVVVPRERFSVSARALETLYERTRYPFSLVYVDGGAPRSVRRQLELASRRHGFSLIRRDRYLTPNQARNLALRQVRTKYVVSLDNDVLVTRGWLDGLVRCAEDTGASVVGPVTCIGEPECEIVHSAGGVAHVAEWGTRRHFVHQNHFEYSRLDNVLPLLARRETEMVEFHCMLIRTDVLARIGALDEEILNDPHHVDFSMTVREAGGSIYLEPAAVVTQLAPPPVPWSDLPFFLQRWNEPATRRSLEHFRRKWRLPDDDPSVAAFSQWLVDRRLLAFGKLHWMVQAAVGWRAGTWIERTCLVPLEAAVSGAVFYALRERGPHDSPQA
jgi:cellulose synthase/poly-beta-1,6-N-acetylglucosamine synthase-like glycosyltransferase